MEPADAWPIGADEFKRRSGSYDRWRSIIAAIGYAPFLLIYLLVHTKYLRPYFRKASRQPSVC